MNETACPAGPLGPGGPCPRCGGAEGTVETRIYSAKKVSRLRGCACGTAVLDEYAIRTVFVCPACAEEIKARSRRRATLARALVPVAAIAGALAYYALVEPEPYPSAMAGLLAGAVFLPFAFPNERRDAAAFLGRLDDGPDGGSYVPRFAKPRR